MGDPITHPIKTHSAVRSNTQRSSVQRHYTVVGTVPPFLCLCRHLGVGKVGVRRGAFSPNGYIYSDMCLVSTTLCFSSTVSSPSRSRFDFVDSSSVCCALLRDLCCGGGLDSDVDGYY